MQCVRVWRQADCNVLQAYISELATLLVQLGNNPSDAELRQRLDQVTLESSHLMGIIKPLNLKVYKAILEGRLDEGRTGEQRLLDNHFYATLPVGFRFMFLDLLTIEHNFQIKVYELRICAGIGDSACAVCTAERCLYCAKCNQTSRRFSLSLCYTSVSHILC